MFLDTAFPYPIFMGIDDLIAALSTAPAAALFSDEVVLEDHGQSMVYIGREAVISVLRAYFGEGFPDGRMCLHTTLCNEQAAVLAFTFRGRQERVFLGIPATGREVAVPMILFCDTANQQIQRIACYYDAGTLLRQLGLSIA